MTESGKWKSRLAGGLLPTLPAGWVWDTDEDGDWFARHPELRATVYVASNPSHETVRSTRCDVPVRVAVAVAQANEMPWEPSARPVGGPWANNRLPDPEPGFKWAQVRVRKLEES